LNNLRYLIISHERTLTRLLNILCCTQHVSYLCCFHINESECKSQWNPNIALNYLSICLNDVEFKEFQGFLWKIGSCLQDLHVKINSDDKNYLNAHHWEKLIIKKLTRLEKFVFNYSASIDEEFNPFRPAPRSKSVKNSLFIYSFSLDHGYCQNPIKNFKKLILGQIWTCCQKATSGRKGTRK